MHACVLEFKGLKESMERVKGGQEVKGETKKREY
jgi:hypothetical protein